MATTARVVPALATTPAVHSSANFPCVVTGAVRVQVIAEVRGVSSRDDSRNAGSGVGWQLRVIRRHWGVRLPQDRDEFYLVVLPKEIDIERQSDRLTVEEQVKVRGRSPHVKMNAEAPCGEIRGVPFDVLLGHLVNMLGPFPIVLLS